MAALTRTSSFITGKNAIVTGGSGTIGRSIAKALLSHGADVIITGRNPERLETARTQLEAFGNVSTFRGDISDEGSVLDLFNYIDKSHGGRCDLLVNNAGIASTEPTLEVPGETFQNVMNTNVVGPFLCSREAMKRMKNVGEGGRIINIGSLSAMSPRPDSVPYTTSKFAILGLTYSLALDARQYGVAVGVIHPGNVMSGLLTEDTIKERDEKEGFISAENVTDCVMTMANMPYSANVLELTVMPTRQPLVGRG